MCISIDNTYVRYTETIWAIKILYNDVFKAFHLFLCSYVYVNRKSNFCYNTFYIYMDIFYIYIQEVRKTYTFVLKFI